LIATKEPCIHNGQRYKMSLLSVGCPFRPRIGHLNQKHCAVIVMTHVSIRIRIRIRQHMSAYVSMRQHTHTHTQHTSAYG
jgi:hypothetical protein